ncbi:type IV toxin-antitoxin system AbiEi family antitoxin domain-containing protein [Trueperella pecoris]|uniref:type IV toxin-antitoxin system AbiEi family antitoxin domain-containing protein n=1 Tax=Trueperella pecoris TaxID=2733571 RepID=UPI00186BA655|nr:type IV toxin-antitoxin system AbiEi family antitoxin domain-containing protein [Trueperella pecoris]QOQ39496.1 type IV toxin-antitoxin system AbiEi family antitoxin domain-containing protein [Trueperella pecoris]
MHGHDPSYDDFYAFSYPHEPFDVPPQSWGENTPWGFAEPFDGAPFVARNFGVFTTSDLQAIGINPRTFLPKAVAKGRLRRLERGIYARPGANSQVVRAILLGGRISCLSACKLYGLWVPHSPRLHVLTLRNVMTAKNSDVIMHSQHRRPPLLVPSPLETVEQVLHFHDAETGLMVLDSALNKGLLRLEEVPELIRNLSKRKQRVLIRATGLAQSGLETRVRNFLISERVPVRPQVEIPTVGRVDMVAGESLILECNGDAFHSTKEQRNRDYLRIQNAKLLGYETVSLSYEQIFYRWEETKAYLRRLIRQRRHLRKPTPLR